MTNHVAAILRVTRHGGILAVLPVTSLHHASSIPDIAYTPVWTCGVGGQLQWYRKREAVDRKDNLVNRWHLLVPRDMDVRKQTASERTALSIGGAFRHRFAFHRLLTSLSGGQTNDAVCPPNLAANTTVQPKAKRGGRLPALRFVGSVINAIYSK